VLRYFLDGHLLEEEIMEVLFQLYPLHLLKEHKLHYKNNLRIFNFTHFLLLLLLYCEILIFQLEFFYLNIHLLLNLLVALKDHHYSRNIHSQRMDLLKNYISTVFCKQSNLFQSSRFQVYWSHPLRTCLPNHLYYSN
jgi:hypothetical protein